MREVKMPETIDEYIVGFSPEIQKRLKELRTVIKVTAPKAEEKISYGMPAFTYKGMLLYFAAHKNHIGFYPLTTAIIAFKQELSPYKTSKGAIQFPNDKPLPLKLIKEMVKFRVIENQQKEELKKVKKRKK